MKVGKLLEQPKPAELPHVTTQDFPAWIQMMQIQNEALKILSNNIKYINYSFTNDATYPV